MLNNEGIQWKSPKCKTIQNKTHSILTITSLNFYFEYICFYKSSRICFCSLFQFTPAIRPSLQTIAIGLVAFGENYKRHQSGIGQHHLIFSLQPLIIQSHHSHSWTVLIHPHVPSPSLLGPWLCTFLMLCVLDRRCSFILCNLKGWLLCFLHISECFEHAHTVKCRIGEWKKSLSCTQYTECAAHTDINILRWKNNS